MGWKRIGLMRRPAAGGEARSRASFLLFFLFFQPQNTGGKNGDNGNSVGYGNPECSIHKKRLRNNVYQQIRGRVQNPQVIGEEDFVEKNKLFAEICRYDSCQQRQDGKKQYGSSADHPRQNPPGVCL